MRRQTLLAMVVAMMASPAILAQSSRLVFVTDRTTTGDLDTWKSREDGTQPVEVTDESGDSHHPSISRDGSKIVFEFGGDLYSTNINGSGTPANLTGSGTNPCNESSTNECGDPEAGPEIGGGDFWVVFTRRYNYNSETPPDTVTDLWMATFDASAGTLGDFVPLTPDLTPADGAQLQPAWCANDRVVWSRASAEDFYYREICILEVDGDGPVGEPTCYLGSNGDGLDDIQPSCNADGSKVAWARPGAYGSHDIWVMECDKLDCDTPENLMEDSHELDDLHPVWSPSGTQIAFISDRARQFDQGDDDLDVWRMNSIDGSQQENLTDNEEIEDNDVDWGGASL